MSFLQFIRILWARRGIIVGATAACFIAAMLAAYLLPARYEAASRVMLDVVKPDPVTGEVISTTFARAYTRTQTELIRDYRVTGAVVDRLGWTSSPVLLARYNSQNSGEKVDFRRWLAQIVSANTSAKLIEGSNILEITYTGASPEAARTVADTLRDAYVEQSLGFKREAATKSADWFDRQVVKVRSQLAAADARKTAYERANRIVLNDDQTDTESSRLRALASQAPAAPMMSGGGGGSPAALQLAQLDARIASAAGTLGPNHPEIQDLRRQRAALAGAAAREGAASRGGPSGPSLEGQVAAQQSRVIAQRDKIETLRQLSSDVQVLRDQYNKSLARAAELHQQAESNEAGLTLLGSAIAPEKASFPNMPLITFGSLAFGLGLGVLAALVTELLSRRVRGVEDLTAGGVPVIVLMGNWAPPRPSLLQRLRLRGAGAA